MAHSFVDDARSLGHRVTRLVTILDLREGTGVSDVLREVRDLLRAFQSAEARNVRVALADASFPFTTIQECLGTLRRSFASITRLAADGLEDRLAPEERQELLQIALLAQTAPLTTLEDVAAIRAARATRRQSAVA
jgi:hypothetical protein